MGSVFGKMNTRNRFIILTSYEFFFSSSFEISVLIFELKTNLKITLMMTVFRKGLMRIILIVNLKDTSEMDRINFQHEVILTPSILGPVVGEVVSQWFNRTSLKKKHENVFSRY